MPEDIMDYSQELRKKNEPFAMATVVRREAPSSSKAGDKAIINKFGEISGWIGGGCVKGIVLKEAEDAMRYGKARLVRIGKSLMDAKQNDVMEYKMTCQSEGLVEIFIDPVLPAPHVVVVGKTVIARALVKLAKAAGYRVTGVAPDANLQTFDKVDELITQLSLANVKTTPASMIVVATQGEQDEKALAEALRKDRAYLGFVSSRKKYNAVQQYLLAEGFEPKAVESIKSPAGIDINAKKPGEVAISILAEMIMVQNSSDKGAAFAHYEGRHESMGISAPPSYYINPVCGVPVDIHQPKHVIDYNGEKVYFCCDGCKVKFEKDPAKYMEAKALGLKPEGM